MAEGVQSPATEASPKAEASAQRPRRLDLVDLLRDRAYASKFPDPLVAAAADEIERLRKREALWSACAIKTMEIYGGCIRPGLDGGVALPMPETKRAEVSADYHRPPCQDSSQKNLTLTDAEREALEAAARIIDAYEEEMDGFSSGASSTLRGLLERVFPDA